MNRNTLFSILATAALGLVMAGRVNATDYKWIGNGHDEYHIGTNWNPTGIPGTTDKATIDRAQTPGNYMDPVLDDEDRLLGELVIGTGFKLTVTGVKLTLEGNSHTLNGNLILSNSTSKVEFTHAQASGWVTLTGSGGIKGEDASAEVRLNDSKIDNDSVLHGIMTVKKVGGDTATFKNGGSGIVRANVNGTLAFAAGLTLDDDSGAKWQAITDTNAELEFNEAATGLVGVFALDDCALIDVNANITTTGALQDKDGNATPEGIVDATASGVTFTYGAGADTCSTCCEFGGCDECP